MTTEKKIMSVMTLCVAPVIALANTIYVSAEYGNDGNDGSQAKPVKTIQAGVDKLVNGWPSRLWISNGVYKLDTQIVFGNNGGNRLTIISSVSGNPEDVIIDGQNTVRCIKGDDSYLRFYGITVANGKATDGYASGLWLAGSSYVVSNCVVRNCRAESTSVAVSGGGLFAQGGATIMDTLFTGCSAEVIEASKSPRGGGFMVGYTYNETGEGWTTIHNVVVSNCAARGSTLVQGGGVWLNKANANGLVVTDCMATNTAASPSSAIGMGGGIYKQTYVDATFENVFVTNCAANAHGGGFYGTGASATLTLTNCTFSGNAVQTLPASKVGNGGGACFQGADYKIANCRFYGNRLVTTSTDEGGGGGLRMDGATVSLLSDSDVSGNTTSGVGGAGIFAKNGIIKNCTVTNNVCTYSGSGSSGGSGIRLHTYGVIDGCLVKDNTFTSDCSDYNGGGSAVWLANGSSLVNSAIIGNSGARSVGMQWSNCGGILVSNCLFKSNVARLSGASGRGGVLSLYALKADSLITDCRFIDNQAATLGGFVEMTLDSGSGDATLRIRNCLIAGNTQTAGGGLVWAISGTSTTARRLALENCTIVSNTIPTGNIITPYFETGYTSRNFVSVSGCVILFNNGKPAFDNTYKASANVTYNCTELSEMSEGNITYDSTKPLFVDLGSGDYRPTADSQLRDIVPAEAWMGDGSLDSKKDLGGGCELQPSGTYGVNVVWTDAVPRLYKNLADIGCFEFWLPPTPPGLVIILK